MATIIAVYKGSDLVGRCDARCHEAKEPECHCICGGAYHGVGSVSAAAGRFDLTDDEILEGLRNCRVFRKIEQKKLFG